MLKNQKGITLVSLVITVIVLMILAGVGISLAMGSDSIFGHANNAATAYNQSVANENAELNNLLTKANEIISNLNVD